MERFVRDFQRQGGRIVAGSDAEGPLGLHRELRVLMEAGIDPLAALHAATGQAAAALGIEERLGTIGAGKTADLVLLPFDPTRPDPWPSSAPSRVIKGGVVHDVAALLRPYERERVRETVRAWIRLLALPAVAALVLIAGALWLWRRRSRAAPG